MKRILVTGGAGFIGSHLVDKLIKEGFEVVVLDDLSNGLMDNLKDHSGNENMKFIKGSILDPAAVKTAMEDVDYVYHLACLGVRHSIHSPFENHQVNAEGSLRLLMEAKERAVKHFFYISTSEVYGRTTSFPIDEKSPTNPLTVYGASKLAGEHYTNAFWECYSMPVTVLRIFNNYGPRAHYEGDAGEIIPRSIVRILYNQQPVIFGNGSITRDFFFVKDTARALHQFLEIAGKDVSSINGQTYNIGTGEEVSMKDLIEQVLYRMDKKALGMHFMTDRPADVPRLWVNAAKFRKLTSFDPKWNFDDGLDETIQYYREKVKERDLSSEITLENWKKIPG